MTRIGVSCLTWSAWVAFLLELRDRQRLLLLRMPAGQRVGQENLGAFGVVLSHWRVQVLHSEPDLEVGDNERGRHDLETEHPLHSSLLHLRPGERS